MTTLIEAWHLGAKVIEKHFTLDKNLKGNDHYHAMNPDDIRNFIKYLSEDFYRSDKEIHTKIQGKEKKVCLPCEEAARLNARRSIVAKVDIAQGETITIDKLTFKRPAHGISPKNIDKVIGKISSENIEEGTVININKIE